MAAKIKIKIEEMLTALSERIFWKPSHPLEIDLVITAFKEINPESNAV